MEREPKKSSPRLFSLLSMFDLREGHQLAAGRWGAGGGERKVGVAVASAQLQGAREKGGGGSAKQGRRGQRRRQRQLLEG